MQSLTEKVHGLAGVLHVEATWVGLEKVQVRRDDRGIKLVLPASLVLERTQRISQARGHDPGHVRREALTESQVEATDLIEADETVAGHTFELDQCFFQEFVLRLGIGYVVQEQGFPDESDLSVLASHQPGSHLAPVSVDPPGGETTREISPTPVTLHPLGDRKLERIDEQSQHQRGGDETGDAPRPRPDRTCTADPGSNGRAQAPAATRKVIHATAAMEGTIPTTLK